jgi:hypothetical protein
VRFDGDGLGFALRVSVIVFGVLSSVRSAPAFAADAPAPPCAEQRVLVNLARSAIGDAFFEMQRQFDGRQASWNDWALFGKQAPPPRTVEPLSTRETLSTSPVEWAAYQIDDVQVVRVRAVPDGAAFGLVDLRSTIRFRAKGSVPTALTLVERHTLMLSDAGPIRAGGRTVEVSPTPVMSALEAGTPCRAGGPEEDALAAVHADLVQSVQRPDPGVKAAIDVAKGQTQSIVGQLLPDGNVTGRLAVYRQSPATGPSRRLERTLSGASRALPGNYAVAGFMLLDGAAGAPFARIVLRPVQGDATKVPPLATFTALVRIAGPEMLGGQAFDWSFMNPVREIPPQKPQ